MLVTEPEGLFNREECSEMEAGKFSAKGQAVHELLFMITISLFNDCMHGLNS